MLSLLLVQIFCWFTPISFVPMEQAVDKNQATVYIFLSDECTISRYYMPDLNKIYHDYAAQNVEFIGVFPNFSSKKEKIAAFNENYKIEFETTTDYYKKLCKQYEVTIVPSIVVLDNQGKKVYKGRIDNSYYRIGKRRRVVNSFELKDVLDSLINNGTSTIKDQKAIGCFINYADLK